MHHWDQSHLREALHLTVITHLVPPSTHRHLDSRTRLQTRATPLKDISKLLNSSNTESKHLSPIKASPSQDVKWEQWHLVAWLRRLISLAHRDLATTMAPTFRTTRIPYLTRWRREQTTVVMKWLKEIWLIWTRIALPRVIHQLLVFATCGLMMEDHHQDNPLLITSGQRRTITQVMESKSASTPKKSVIKTSLWWMALLGPKTPT